MSRPVTNGATPLKHAIVDSGIPQRRIAKKLRVSTSHLSRIVCGLRPPTPDEQEQLADILGQSRRALFP